MRFFQLHELNVGGGGNKLPASTYNIYYKSYTIEAILYAGCPLKKVGAVESMEESRRTKKSYTILPISQ